MLVLTDKEGDRKVISKKINRAVGTKQIMLTLNASNFRQGFSFNV